MKLEKLTPEQEEKMVEVKNFWLNYIFSCKNSIDKPKIKDGVKWIYELANKKEPVMVYVESPFGCQLAITYLKEVINQKPELFTRDSVSASVWASVRASVWDSKIEYNNFASYGSISDYGWVSFYDFFTQIGVINNEKFNQFKDIILSGVYDMVQLEGFCIVSNLPDKINRDNNSNLHSSNGSAIHFRDGYELFFWHGVNVIERWIKEPQTISKDEILKEGNTEKRRVLREILGAKKYYDIISDGKGLILLDEDTDDMGFPMKLYETTINDDLINKKIQFIEVVCPSTERVYNIYPPSQNCKNVWEAKADTFNKKGLKYRHGDVGIIDLKKKYNHPILES